MPVSMVNWACLAISLPWSQVMERRSARAGARSWRPSRRGLLGAVPVGQMQQHHVPGGAFDQGADRAVVVRAHDQVAFPVAGHRPVFDLGGPFGDHHHVRGCWPRRSTRPWWSALGAAGAQTAVQFTAQPTSALDVQRLVDRLVRHPHLRPVRELEAAASPRSPAETTAATTAPRPGGQLPTRQLGGLTTEGPCSLGWGPSTSPRAAAHSVTQSRRATEPDRDGRALARDDDHPGGRRSPRPRAARLIAPPWG